MSSSNDSHVPDLASVLKTLASLAPQNYQASSQVFPQHDQDRVSSGHEQSQQPPAPTLEAFLPKTDQPTVNPSKPVNTQKKLVDPATIVEWSAGLRCVMKTIAKHEYILHEVRRMIKVQHEHEEQWWNGRQALLTRQRAREEGQKKLDEVLKAVGGSISAAPSNTNPDELARELETFDMKVWKAQMQMVREMNAKLRSLGIPFFGTRSDLVRPAGKEVGGAEDKAVIDEADLVKLQRRMLEMLEDLCNDQ